MTDLGLLTSQLVFALPVLITLIIGMALIVVCRTRLTPLARNIALAGFVVLLGDRLASLAYTIMLPELLRDRAVANISLVTGLAGAFFMLMNCVGLSLLIAAVLQPHSKRGTPGA